MMKTRFFALLLLMSFSTLEAQISQDNLLAYYSFDSNVLDTGPNQLHGISYGTTYGEDEQGNPNSALFFDGIDDFVDLSAFAILFRENLTKMTILYKVLFEKQETNQTMISLGNDGEGLENNVFEFEYENKRIQIETETGAIAVNHQLELNPLVSPLIFGGWHQVMLVLDGEDITYCRDGTVVFQGKYTPAETLSNDLFIGCFAGTSPVSERFFGGYIDDLQFYSRIVDKEELTVSKSYEPWLDGIKYYPNPTHDKVFVEFNDFHKNVSILLADSQGRAILNQEIREVQSFDLTLPALPGFYLLQVISQDKIATFKIIKTPIR